GIKPVSVSNSSYRPLQFVSYWLDYHVFGRTPSAMHLHSIILGFLFLVLFFLLSWTLFQSPGWSLVATAILSLHPLLVEVIVYITSRSDLLMAFFILACI